MHDYVKTLSVTENLWYRWRINECGSFVQWNWQGKTEVLGDNPVTVPLCPSQISYWLFWNRKQAACCENPNTDPPPHPTNRPNHAWLLLKSFYADDQEFPAFISGFYGSVVEDFIILGSSSSSSSSSFPVTVFRHLFRGLLHDSLPLGTYWKIRLGTLEWYIRCKTCFWRTDISDGKMRKKMLAATGWREGKERILGIEIANTRSHCLWKRLWTCRKSGTWWLLLLLLLWAR